MPVLTGRRVPVAIVSALLCVAVLIALFAPTTTYIHWVGSKDLEIAFRIIDADSGDPVKEAKVEVLHEWTSFCTEDQKPPFSLNAGQDGIAKHLSKQCMCFGTAGGSGSRKKDTFAIHIPGWVLAVEAPGYAATEPFDLDTVENQRRVIRGTDKAKLEVVVQLNRRVEPKQVRSGQPGGE